jgi:serine/threonine-protein kinase
VSDFGIAKTVDDLDQTQTAELVATPGYLAPERLAGGPASQRSDLYSVGVLLYEALSGRRPFGGDTPLAVMRAIERGQAEPLTSMRPAPPVDVIAIVERAMSRDPLRRFASAEEMAAALDSSVALDSPADLDATVPVPRGTGTVDETVPIVVAPRDGETQILHPAEPRKAPGETSRPPGRPGARRRVLAVGVGAALVGVLVAGVVASQRGDDGLGGPLPTTSTSAAPARSTPANTRVPAPLDAAITRLEQAIAQ